MIFLDKTCIYLRKSRTDEELERTLGEGETLAKHRKTLLKFAKEHKLNIVEIKEEIVSGDSLFFRPKMLELLKEIENKEYSGVLVMDIDRLGRGGMKDQGIILDAFKQSNTLIITPGKTYDLQNEFDEEMTEFKTFFSRRELKTINRRMQGGRIRSVEDGNYIASGPPLGYDITYINKNRTLKINDYESKIIHTIFNMYTSGEGAGSIAMYLNSLNYKTKAKNDFTASSVLNIIKNPVYVGKVTWKKKEIKKSVNPNKLTDTRTRDKNEWIISNGKHKPIIDIETFNRATEILKNRYHVPYKLVNGITNPFAGIIVCSTCNRKMVMRKLRGIERILCTNNKCNNKSTKLSHIEKAILNGLDNILDSYKSQIENDSTTKEDMTIYVKQIASLEKELETLKKQKLNLYDLLERGIYDDETFLNRAGNLDERMDKLTSSILTLNNLIMSNNETNSEKLDIDEFENIVDVYKRSNDIKHKNELLKSILYRVEYLKTPDQRNDEFEINIYPKI